MKKGTREINPSDDPILSIVIMFIVLAVIPFVLLFIGVWVVGLIT